MPILSSQPLSSAGGGLLNSLIASLQQSSNQANSDSLAQYKNLLNSVQGLTKNVVGKGGQYSQAMAQLDKAGQTATADTKENIQNQLGSTNQDLVNRGLGNTTIRSNMLAGVQNKGQRELNAITENVGQQKAGLIQNQAGATMDLGKLMADSILSKQNMSPDLGMYMQLIQQLAASQQAAQPRTIKSNMGSISALNAPMSFNSAGSTAGGSPAFGGSPAMGGGSGSSVGGAGGYITGGSLDLGGGVMPGSNASGPGYAAELSALRQTQNGVVYDNQYQRLRQKYAM